MDPTPTLGPVNDLCLPLPRKAVLVQLSSSPPRCPYCGAPEFTCVTDWRGLCAEMDAA